MQSGKFIEASQIYNKNDISHPYPCYGGNGLRGYVSSYNRNGSFPIIGRQGALCGNVNFTQGYFYATEHAVVVDTFTYTDEVWATYFLIQLNLNQYATATAQPGLSVKKISEVLMPLPPFQEQKRIVAEIEKWFSFIDNIKDETKELELLIKKTKSKILDLAISGKLVPQDPSDEPAIELLKRINPNFVPCDNSHYENVPEGWTICKISDLCKIENGFAFSSDDYKTSGIPLIRISNITNNTIDLSDCVYIENIEINDKYIISKGDLLIAMSGATTGKMGVYKNNNISFLNQRVCNVKIIDNSVLVHSYRNYFLQSKVSEILTLAYGGAQPNISTTMIGNIEILLPPYNEQERIVSTIEFIFTQINTITAEL